MPWDHCDVDFILDDESCPACGLTKAAWTVEIDRTRTLIVSKKRLTLAHVARVLQRLHEEGALAVSRRFLRALDHSFLNELARKGVAKSDPKNDPSLLAANEKEALARHVLLWGMRGEDYRRVPPTQRLLAQVFDELKEDAAYQDELSRGWFGDASLQAYDRWLDEVAPEPGVVA